MTARTAKHWKRWRSAAAEVGKGGSSGGGEDGERVAADAGQSYRDRTGWFFFLLGFLVKRGLVGLFFLHFTGAHGRTFCMLIFFFSKVICMVD